MPLLVATLILALVGISITYLRARRQVAALTLEIQRQQMQSAAVDAIKDELIGNVSHELRTPLTSIRGALGLLSAGLTGSLDPKGQHLLRIALTNTDRLIRLVTDILDLERMEAGRAGLHLRRCSLTSLIQQAIETISLTAETARVTLSFTAIDRPEPAPAQTASNPGLPTLAQPIPIHLPAPEHDRRSRRTSPPSALEPAFFDADPDRILQVLANLLSNAIKFSPPETTVSLELTATPGTLHLRVQDQGRGIPDDKLDLIFDRFQQVDVGDSRQKGGTGLGLAICRTIVHQHGGTIRAEPNQSAGACLCVDLPRIQRFSDQGRAASTPIS